MSSSLIAIVDRDSNILPEAIDYRQFCICLLSFVSRIYHPLLYIKGVKVKTKGSPKELLFSRCPFGRAGIMWRFYLLY